MCNAAYGQEWFQANQEYKKILLFLLTRAKKPKTLNATSMLSVSLMTFNRVRQIQFIMAFFIILYHFYISGYQLFISVFCSGEIHVHQIMKLKGFPSNQACYLYNIS